MKEYAVKDMLYRELNKNTQDVNFSVSLFHEFNNDDYSTLEPVEQTYAFKKKLHIPTMIDEIMGDYANVPDRVIFDGHVGLTFNVPIEDENQIQQAQKSFKDFYKAIDEFKLRNIGKVTYLGERAFDMRSDYRLMLTHTDISPQTFHMKFRFDKRENELLFVSRIKEGEPVLDYDFFSIERTNTSIKIVYNYDVGGTLTTEEEILFEYDLDKEYDFIFGVLNDGDDRKLFYILNDGFNILDKTHISSFTLPTSIDTTTRFCRIGGVNGLFYKFGFSIKINTIEEIEKYLKGKSTIDKILDYDFYLEDFDLFGEDSEVIGDFTVSREDTTKNCIEYGSEGTCVLFFEPTNPISGLVTMGDKVYQQFQLGFRTFITGDAFFGNHIKYKLDGKDVFISRGFGRVGEPEGDQMVGGFFTKNVIDMSGYGYTMDCFLDKRDVMELVEETSDDTFEQNKKYELIIEYPYFKRNYSVVLNTVGYQATNQQLVTVSLEYSKRDDEALDE